MSRLSTFDFQTNRRRTTRFSLFALPPPHELESVSELETETKAELAAMAVVCTSPEPSPSELRIQSERRLARNRVWYLGTTVCFLVLAFAAVLTLQIFHDLRHPLLKFPDLDTDLAKSLYPSTTTFYIHAASTNQVEARVKSVPAGAHVGVIFTIDKCEPQQMIKLADFSAHNNVTEITLMPSKLDYTHTTACLYFLASLVQDQNYDIKLATGVMKQPKFI